MKLLAFTQKVDMDDDILGFFHDWATEFSKHTEHLIIICLYEGRHKLPANVKVLSLGKENYPLDKGGQGGLLPKRLTYIYKFYKYLWRERNGYDSVFVHMNYEYVLLGGPVWRLTGKHSGLWFAHGSTSLGLRIAGAMSNIIFTSTQSGYRLKSKKIKVVGQGIDTEKFKPDPIRTRQSNVFKIVTVGRISPSKDLETLIKAIEILSQDKSLPQLNVEIVGGAGLKEQEGYFILLKELVKKKRLENVIKFIGAVPNHSILGYLQASDLFVNMSHTGSLDKAMLEAMAAGLPVLTCNEAMLEVLGDYKNLLMYQKKDSPTLGQKIKYIAGLKNGEYKKLSDDMRNIVVRDHSLPGLIDKIINNY